MMNCRDCQEWLQRELDGEPGPTETALAGHLAGCPDCRRLHTAARRLRQGLLLQTQRKPPAPPPGLAGRVLARVLAERRRRQRWRLRLAGAVALAASLLLIVAAGRFGPRSQPEATQYSAQGKTPPGPPAPSSLRETVAAVVPSFADLTSRTFDMALEETKVLVPVVDSSVLAPMPMQSFETPNPFREVGKGVASGLEPVGNAAWQMFALFRRTKPAL
jgi:hypothetical protein